MLGSIGTGEEVEMSGNPRIQDRGVSGCSGLSDCDPDSFAGDQCLERLLPSRRATRAAGASFCCVATLVWRQFIQTV